jgi:uncharacterized membrane protein
MVYSKTNLSVTKKNLVSNDKIICGFFCILTCIFISSNVQARKVVDQTNVSPPKIELEKLPNTPVELYEIQQLKIAIALQETKVQNLEKKLEAQIKATNTAGISFEVWIGILLACIAILLTVLGLGMAILSFFGYNKVVSSAATSAETVAKAKAEETVKILVGKATEDEIIKLIDKGNFNTIISHAVDNVVYRGINAVDDFDDNEKL